MSNQNAKSGGAAGSILDITSWPFKRFGRVLSQASSPAPEENVSPELRQKLKDESVNSAVSNVFNYGLSGLTAGGTLAALAYLSSRLRRPSQREGADEARKSVGPILSLSQRKSASEKSADKGDNGGEVLYGAEGVDWKTPASLVAGSGGALLGYLALRKYLDNKRMEELRQERSRAEAAYTRALSHALSPQGLRVTSKDASFHELSDEDACMVVMDEWARSQASGEKQASFWGKVGWWSLLPALALFGGGAALGQRLGATGNRYRSELNNLQKRRVLQALNSPQAPILTVQGELPSPHKKDEDEDEDEDEKTPDLRKAAATS